MRSKLSFKDVFIQYRTAFILGIVTALLAPIARPYIVSILKSIFG